MMLVDDFVAPLPVVEMALRDQFAFLEQLQRTVNSGVADVRINLLNLGVQLFGADMASQGKEHAGDIVALPGGLQPAVLKPCVEHLQPLISADARTARDGRMFRALPGMRHESSDSCCQRLTPVFLQQPACSRRQVEAFEVLTAQGVGQNLDLLGGRQRAIEDDEVFLLDLT
jgi:hypothetical protein